jgi:DNA-binding transcriptional regulator YdaS (Cro superfamily)
MNAVERAISILGSQAKLAAACEVTQTAVHKWLYGADIRAENAIKVEKATNGAVTRQQLRPDIFGDAA